MAVTEEIAAVLKLKAEGLVTKSSKILSEIMDPAFVYVSSGGRRSEKQAYIDRVSTATDWGFGHQLVENLEVVDFGGFAVATMTLHDQFVHSTGTVERTYLSLCVFRKEGGRWLWAAGQTMAPDVPFTADIEEAKKHLSSLYDRAAAGEEIVIAVAGTPKGKLIRADKKPDPAKAAPDASTSKGRA
jgi:antitoxin (DNA-binding transcriptional repressor) of toxin-antitoxin stability system